MAMKMKELPLSGVEYVDKCWNPIPGCNHGCQYTKGGCYARRLNMMQRGTFEPELAEERLNVQLPGEGIVFCNDMGDGFGSWVPKDWITSILRKIVESGSKAAFLMLTKNPVRYREFFNHRTLTSCGNIWLGTTLDRPFTSSGWDSTDPLSTLNVIHHDTPSVEDRIKAINELDYPRKWLSIEPLDYNRDTIDFYVEKLAAIDVQWVVVGFKNPAGKVPRWAWDGAAELVTTFTRRKIPVLVKSSIAGKDPATWPGKWPREFPPGMQLATKSAGTSAIHHETGVKPAPAEEKASEWRDHPRNCKECTFLKDKTPGINSGGYCDLTHVKMVSLRFPENQDNEQLIRTQCFNRVRPDARLQAEGYPSWRNCEYYDHSDGKCTDITRRMEDPRTGEKPVVTCKHTAATERECDSFVDIITATLDKKEEAAARMRSLRSKHSAGTRARLAGKQATKTVQKPSGKKFTMRLL